MYRRAVVKIHKRRRSSLCILPIDKLPFVCYTVTTVREAGRSPRGCDPRESVRPRRQSPRPRGRHVARNISVNHTPLLGSGTRGSRRGKNYPRGVVNLPIFYLLALSRTKALNFRAPARRHFAQTNTKNLMSICAFCHIDFWLTLW